MSALRRLRESRHLSQRALARRAGVAFRSVQLMESGRHNPRWSTLTKLAEALGARPSEIARNETGACETIRDCSMRVARDGKDSWKIHLLEFVDAFRGDPDARRLADAPVPATDRAILAMIAATVETLSDEAGIRSPWWCAGIPPLPDPWFVSGTESLKAAALVESPAPFRQRNVFVLANVLSRA